MNIRNIFLCAVLIFSAITTSAATHLDSVYKVGVNWLVLDSSLDGGTYKRMLEDTLGFNMAHSFYRVHQQVDLSCRLI